MTKINHNSCWRKLQDDKKAITFKCEKNGNETITAFKIGKDWAVSGGRDKPERVTFAPTFYSSKKRALMHLSSAVSRCPRTYKKNGLTITEYTEK